MLRTSLFCTVLTTSLIPACTGDSTSADELAGESAADGDASKADGAGTFTFFTIEPDTRACSLDSPHCGAGFFVSRPNRKFTVCARGQSANSCYVDSLDLGGTGLTDAAARLYVDRIRAGEAFLLRGDIVPAPDDRNASLVVTEIWVGGSEVGVDEGTFVLAQDTGIQCIQAPCPSIRERKLNSTLTASVDQIDFSTSGASDEAIGHAESDMHDGGNGVIVVGYRFTDGRSKGRTANQFYTKVSEVTAEPKRCGGFLPRFCDNGEYCDYTADTCGAADHTGVCRPLPDACAQIFEPVCACDFQTYDNACLANLAGFDVAREGACE